MNLLLRFTLFGWGVDLDLGQREDPHEQEHVALSGGPIGFALPEEQEPGCECDDD